MFQLEMIVLMMVFSLNVCCLQKGIVKVRKLNKNAEGDLEEQLQSIKDC